MLRPEFHLIDGENLVHRYQSMIADGRDPLPGVVHAKDVFVWHPSLIHELPGDIRRVSYYTSVVGDDDRVHEIAELIHGLTYSCVIPGVQKRGAKVCPQVFKKQKQTNKSRAVDINITIDAMRHASNGSAGHVSIYSGDSDFLPLIKELMRLGMEVHVKALSAGLGSAMRIASDQFFSLDHCFFEQGSG
jgi:uncharacterized LabA/DUF88 family protein